MATEMEFVPYKDFVEGLAEASDFAATDKSVVSNGTNGPRSMPQTTADKIVAQRTLAGNLAPAFDPTRTSGNSYKKDEVVMNGGVAFRFKNDHYGAWSDEDVETVDLGYLPKSFKIISNKEYLFAVVDSSETFIFGVKADGAVEWQKGIPTPVKNEIENINNSKVDKAEGKSLIDSLFAAMQNVETNPEFIKILLDKDGRILLSVNDSGKFDFRSRVGFKGIDWTDSNLSELENALKAYGFTGGQGDWSDKKSLQIQKPKFAIVNFTGIEAMPITKTDDLHATMQFWDLNGNYFKKKVIANAQGNSSLVLPKKNIAIDICNDDWIGDDTFKIKFGKWVAQDSFHLKAYYADFLKMEPVVGYNLFDEILASRDIFSDRTWKKGLVDENDVKLEGLGVGGTDSVYGRMDDGARCFPDGFPCAVYLNDVFYGIFSFQLKKHRDNYMMKKDNPKHIHLDGLITTATMWDGVVAWGQFEIRNPKDLYCADGTKYDGDNPAEIVGQEDAEAWISAGQLPNGTAITSKITKNLRNTYAVKQYIQDFADSIGKIVSKSTTADKKAEFEKYYDKDNLVDYQVFGDALANVDGFAKNWQWTTWDGVKWFVNPYDLDQLFGYVYTGEFAAAPQTSRQRLASGNYPNKLANDFYPEDMVSRYAELRRGPLSYRNICDKLTAIVQTVGYGFLELEYEKWTGCPINRDIVVNSDYWELKMSDGEPVIAHSRENLYSSTTSYSVGDECVGVMGVFDATVDPGWYYTFTCVQNCTGKTPAVYGYRDSIWRIFKWLREQLANMDTLYNYEEA